MSDNQIPTMAYSSTCPWNGWCGWTLALVSAAVVGFLLGVGITGFSYGVHDATDFPGIELESGLPPVIASGQRLGIIYAMGTGIIVGVASAMASRSHPLLATLTASFVAAASSTATIVLWQWHRGRWALGTIDGRMFAVAAALVVLICLAGVLAALAVSFFVMRAGIAGIEKSRKPKRNAS
jgi:hypothetical protein